MPFFRNKLSSLRSQCWMRLFCDFQTICKLNMYSYLPMPKMEACSRYCREIMHCWLFDRIRHPKEMAPMEVATPKNVCNSKASEMPRPSSIANGIWKEGNGNWTKAVYSGFMPSFLKLIKKWLDGVHFNTFRLATILSDFSMTKFF